MSMMTPLARLFGLARNGPGTALGRNAIALSALFAFTVVVLAASSATAQNFEPEDAFALFGTEYGDPFSSVFLNQLFGDLFPSVSGSSTQTVFSSIIGYFNVIILVVGGGLFFWNITVGTLQSAHEGSVLGQKWSSLWAPIRTIFAIGLMIPLPNMGGYNVAQAGVAYVVRGSTMMASTIWTRSAELVITGDVAIASTPPTIDPGVMKTMYLNAACASIVNYQMTQATGDPATAFEVRWQSTPMTRDDITSNVHMSYLFDPSGATSKERICGSYSAPELPLFVNTISDGSTSAVPTIVGRDRDRIKNQFEAAHLNSMARVSNRMLQLTNSILPTLQQPGSPPPDIAPRVADAMVQANDILARRMDNVMNAAMGLDRSGQTARDALLGRIKGSCSTPVGEPSRCYGEGWVGAGSWYMMLAQFNNELTSLTSARGTATEGDYIRKISSENRALYEASGGEFGWFESWRGKDSMAAAGMMSADEATLLMTRYEETWDNSTASLAALGFPIAASLLDELNSEVTNAEGAFLKVPGLAEALNGAVRYAVQWTSPAAWGDDPMIGLIQIGHFLVNIAGVLLVVAAVSGLLGAGFPLMIAPFMATLMTAGSLLSYILPIMPFFYWVLAVTGYFLLVAEAVIAVNLWALAHMRMDGDGISGEAGRQGWLMLLSLLMTPVLMVFGFLLGMGIFRVTSALINVGMNQALAGILGSGIFVKIVAMCVYSIFMVMMYVVLLERSFSLVSEFPSRVLQWMGASAQLTNGEENRARAAAGATAGVVYGAGANQASLSAANKTGKGGNMLAKYLTPKTITGGGGSGGNSPPAGG